MSIHREVLRENTLNSCDLFNEFDQNGYLTIENFFSSDFINSLRVEVMKKIDLLFHFLESNYLPFGVAVKNGYKEVVQRQEKRFEIKLTELSSLEVSSSAELLAPQSINPDLLLSLLNEIEHNPRLLSIVSNLFQGEEFKIIHQSCVLSLPGTAEQKWHSDGPHVSVAEYLPCHCFNVFIPLIDLIEEHGVTEIRPESHHYTNNLTKGLLLATLKKKVKPIAKPILKRGSLLMVRKA
jgi:hypothetical protein